jgi:hypothetical protein
MCIVKIHNSFRIVLGQYLWVELLVKCEKKLKYYFESNIGFMYPIVSLSVSTLLKRFSYGKVGI